MVQTSTVRNKGLPCLSGRVRKYRDFLRQISGGNKVTFQWEHMKVNQETDEYPSTNRVCHGGALNPKS